MRWLWPVAVLSAIAGVACSKENPSSLDDDSNITVTGRVIDAGGNPVQDALVFIGDAQQSVSGGTFSASDVVIPYEVVVVRQAARVALFYRGLTRPDPTIQVPHYAQLNDRSATVNGTVTGGAGFPPPAGHRTEVASLPDPVITGAVSSNGTYAVTRGWQGAGSTTAHVHVLQWQTGPSGSPTGYTGYGSRTGLTLSDGATLSGQDVALGAVSSATITGTITPPAGFTVSVLSLFARPGSGREVLSLARDESGNANFSLPTPVIPGGTVTLIATARMGPGAACFVARTGLQPTLTGVGLSFLTPPTMIQPGSGAVGITNSTEFRWTPSGRAHVVFFESTPDRPTYIVVTPETSTTIRNLSQLGLPLPSGVEYRWTVYGIQESTNEAAEPAGYAQALVTFPFADRSACAVGSRNFTTG